jgi:xylose isomerase
MSDDLHNAFGMKCPHCGSSNRIDVAATVWVRLCKNGTDSFGAENGDHEWTDTSAALCASCDHSGTVASFTEP